MSSADGTSGPAPDAESGTVHKLVSFYLGDKHYAVAARSVAEVTGHLEPIPLPDSPQSLAGIAPHRGDILAVVAAGNSSNTLDAAKRKAIVLRPIGDKVEVPVAFNVDRMGEMLQINSANITASNAGDPLAEFEALLDASPVLIVEPSRIVDLLYT